MHSYNPDILQENFAFLTWVKLLLYPIDVAVASAEYLTRSLHENYQICKVVDNCEMLFT